MTSVTRCCLICGRWGTRQYMETAHGWVCANDRACNRRTRESDWRQPHQECASFSDEDWEYAINIAKRFHAAWERAYMNTCPCPTCAGWREQNNTPTD